ncbi:MAG: DUF2029 domain-containing protein [Bdellovibrionales bacterium]|nr:DUF2029 domain-containing protein [Bdellovibrionales bacterium]
MSIEISPHLLLRKSALVFTIGISIALLFGALTPQLPGSMLESGDLPGFYVAAEILQRSPHRLYDFELQRQIENELWPHFNGHFLAFAYPPYTAVLLSPLALLPPHDAQLIFILINAIALAWSFRILYLMHDTRPENFLAFALILSCATPVAISLVGAQNSCLSLLAIVLTLRGIRPDANTLHQCMAGLGSALLLYKPQFAIFPLLLIALLGSRPARSTAAIVVILLYILGTIPSGLDWPAKWITVATSFGNMNYQINAHQMVSLQGLTYSLAHAAGMSETTTNSFQHIAQFISLGVALACCWTIVLVKKSPQRAIAQRKLEILLPLLIPILAPQTLFYDLTLGIPAACLLWKGTSSKEAFGLLFSIALFSGVFLLRTPESVSLFGITALFLLSLYLWRVLRIQS